MAIRAEERADRNMRIFHMFLGGLTYEEIAPRGGVSVASVSRIVKAQLAAGARRRGLLSDEAIALHMERTERLFASCWFPAIREGDRQAAEICRRILAQQARVIAADDRAIVHYDEDEDTDELAALRARRGLA